MKNHKGVSCSDIHLGHPKVPVSWIIDNFKEYIYPQLLLAQIFFVVGDWFHQLLRFDSDNTQEVIVFLNELLAFLKANNIKMRVLRGTYSHDRGQTKTLMTLNQHFGADVKCIDTMSLEYIEDLDMRLLYIPDNLPYVDTKDCLTEIKNLMKAAQWDTVDYALVHGYFQHVLPPGIPFEPHCTFKSSQFSFVKECVFVGHVHTHSQKDNVIYHGSFDRLAHGEEEKKGFLTFEMNGKFTVQFVENKSAMKFITISPKGETVEELLENLQKQITKKFGKFPVGHLRISLENPEHRQILIQYITNIYNKDLVVIGHSPKQKTNVKIIVENPQFREYEQVLPTAENIAELAFLHIQKRNGDCPLSIEEINQHLLSI